VRGEKGQVGSVLMGFVGWPSVEASKNVWETEKSKESVESIEGMEGIVKFAMFCISCRTVQRRTE